jgi:hypothetical protein
MRKRARARAARERTYSPMHRPVRGAQGTVVVLIALNNDAAKSIADLPMSAARDQAYTSSTVTTPSVRGADIS